jgi:CRP-like cAMP-binding protein
MHEQLINRIRKYIPLSNKDISVIESLFIPRTLKKGELFLKEGRICKELGFINKGLVCYYIIQDGTEVVHNFAKENELICNYDSFINKTPSHKNVVALEPTELMVISFDKLQQLYKSISGGERFGRLHMEQVYSEAIKHIISFYTDTPQQRYSDFVQQHKELVQRVPQYYIASYIGIKPQSLSRIRKRLLQC